MSKNGLFCGIPDYIFKTNNNDNFVVEEKHTWQEVVSKPWDSHIIQVLSYMYGIPFNNKKMKNGYIIYFSWYPKKNNYCNLETRNPRLFKIERNKQNLEKVNRVYNNVKNFNNSKKIKFNIKDLNIKKCLNCSARIYCDHMNGDKKYLELPYNF